MLHLLVLWATGQEEPGFQGCCCTLCPSCSSTAPPLPPCHILLSLSLKSVPGLLCPDAVPPRCGNQVSHLQCRINQMLHPRAAAVLPVPNAHKKVRSVICPSAVGCCAPRSCSHVYALRTIKAYNVLELGVTIKTISFQPTAMGCCHPLYHASSLHPIWP